MSRLNIIPFLGKVAIVDDKIDEVKELMSYLSSNSVSYSYYSGRSTEFPQVEKKSIQFIFLDLLINASTEPKNLASTLVSNINALISKDNGPYILAIWSQNYTSNKEVIENAIDKLPNKPEDWFYLDKAHLNNSPKFNDELTEKIVASFKKNSLVNLSNICAEHFRSNLAKSFYSFNNSILKNITGNKKLSVLLDYVLKNECPYPIVNLTRNDRINLFLPLFEQLVASYSTNYENKNFSISKGLINKKETKELDIFSYNNAVHISKRINQKEPKTVYKSNENKRVFHAISRFQKIKEEEIIPVEIDITHLCTTANNKSNFRTIVYGFLLNCDSAFYKEKRKQDRISDYLTIIGCFYYNNEKYCLIVCCDVLTSKSLGSLHKKDALFVISTKWYRKIRSAVSYLLGKPA